MPRTTAKTVPAVAVMMLIAWPLAAADGILIVQKVTRGTKTETNQIQIEKNRMRAEHLGKSGSEKRVFVFDGPKQVLWLIDYDKKTYNEMTRADVDRIAGQMNDAMAQVRQQMANLPPEQRAQVEAMMRGRGMMGAAAAALRPEYKKTGTDTVGKWTCEKYEGYRDNQKTVELCTVEPQTLGFTAADFEISRQLAAFFAKMLPQGAENLFHLGRAEEQGFSGVPVRQVMFGPIPTTSEIASVSRQNFPDSVFAVPSGFEKTELPVGGRGRGRQ